MGAYTCLKPAKFAGVDYTPGDIIPAEAIPANRVGAVIRLGLIAEAPQAGPGTPVHPQTFTVPIVLPDGTVETLEVTPEAVEEAVAVLQMTAEGAVKHVAGMTDEAALIMIDACTGRKSVKKAAAERAAALEAAAGAG